MDRENPYASTLAVARPHRDLVKLASRFVGYRKRPPTITSMIRAWRALPIFIVVGSIAVGGLTWIAAHSDSMILNHYPTVMGSMLVGAALRDFGTIRRFVRAWPAWNEIIDWKKVEELAE